MRRNIAHPDSGRRDTKRGEENSTERRGPTVSTSANVVPSPDVIAATQVLLAQPDAYLYRRRYLELVVHGRGVGAAADYTAAERYLLASAAACRRFSHRNDSPTGRG